MDKFFELMTNGTDISVLNMSECKYCSSKYPLYSIEKEQYDKYGFKYTDICPTCNFKSLYSYINDKHLYNRKYSKTGNNIISILSEDFSGEVIEANNYRNSLVDDLGFKYSKEIGPDIFADFFKLYNDFPKPSRLVFHGIENGDYSSHVGTSKNLYLSYCIFAECEDIYYSLNINKSKNVFDSYYILDSSNVYSSHTIGTSHDVSFSRNSVDCSGLLFCSDMNNCKECIFCCNKVNKSYMIYNKQYTKEEYEGIKKGIYEKLGDYNQFNFFKNKFQEFLDQNLVDATININNCEKVKGEATFYSSNSINSYNCNGLSNSINIMTGGDSSNDKSEKILNSVEFGLNNENNIGSFCFGYNTYNVNYCGFISECTNIDYCIELEGCEDCLFCVGLRNKKYCILNKQYTKQEYFKLREEIVNHLKSTGKWGENIPFSSSPFPYNDTLAYDIFKVNKVIYIDGKEEIIDENAIGTVQLLGDSFISDAIYDMGGKEKIKIKWRTKNKEINIPENMEILKTENIASINQVGKDILDKAIICEESARPFRIIKQEFDFLKKKGFPVPRIHQENRIDKIHSDRPKGQMHIGICDNCKQETLTVFKNKPKYKVFCPACYKHFMYA
ncbi:MAG: hypothetical protein Q8K30_03425 [Candidatus Gracilibacteria bacterium]|nr:hypothetical protein [Candidatus Gracilibacteria bacterium]